MKFLYFQALFLILMSCQAQNSSTMNESKPSNPLICDPETGSCEVPGDGSKMSSIANTQEKAIKVIYFTDPICSSCWGIEPQLRKLKLEYGHLIEIEYRMGGLLPDWSYNSGGISKPSDVAHHWDEVSVHYDMPIDGDVWLEDPLDSSYPPSIAFKAAQIQDEEKAIHFLRTLREMVFLEKKNITKWEYLSDAALRSGLDAELLKRDYEGQAQADFKDDLSLARALGVRGFPTMFFQSEGAQPGMVYGSQPYTSYVQAITNLAKDARPTPYKRDLEALFNKFNTLSAREFSELSGIERVEAQQILEREETAGRLRKIQGKNGGVWGR